MTILLVLIPVSLVLVGLAIWAFFWAVDDGQFDDLDAPGFRALDDDGRAPTTDAAADIDADQDR